VLTKLIKVTAIEFFDAIRPLFRVPTPPSITEIIVRELDHWLHSQRGFVPLFVESDLLKLLPYHIDSVLHWIGKIYCLIVDCDRHYLTPKVLTELTQLIPEAIDSFRKIISLYIEWLSQIEDPLSVVDISFGRLREIIEAGCGDYYSQILYALVVRSPFFRAERTQKIIDISLLFIEIGDPNVALT
jgi:hypothetical protein